jgi:hypothetical protein
MVDLAAERDPSQSDAHSNALGFYQARTRCQCRARPRSTCDEGLATEALVASDIIAPAADASDLLRAPVA